MYYKVVKIKQSRITSGSESVLFRLVPLVILKSRPLGFYFEPQVRKMVRGSGPSSLVVYNSETSRFDRGSVADP